MPMIKISVMNVILCFRSASTTVPVTAATLTSPATAEVSQLDHLPVTVPVFCYRLLGGTVPVTAATVISPATATVCQLVHPAVAAEGRRE
jgi:hypothetical protein